MPRGYHGRAGIDRRPARSRSHVVEQHAREASAGILQSLKDGRGASHAATILDKLDRAALRELGHDAIVLVVQL